ncbi:MAG: RsmB/NOP family class I SAM-dependent RNA methyltransferase [Nanoarchaeota archaeon]
MNQFISRYKELTPDFALAKEIRKSLRVNTLKLSEQALIERLKKRGVTLEKIPFLQYGYYYESPFSLGATQEFLQGYYYLQEAASQIPAQVLNPSPDDTLLDMAAAPGSKLTQLAQLMQNTGIIIGLDENPQRLLAVRINTERLGITNSLLYKKDARFAFDLGIQFDKILLDAPCSGNYCIEENYFALKTLQGIKERARLQKELLKAALKVLKPGGTLVYSTCSLEPEENELNMHWLLQKYKDVRLEPIDIAVGDPGLTEVFGEQLSPEIRKCRRLWPHRTGTEGFFIAKIQKSA